jgi:hypothetical protein
VHPGQGDDLGPRRDAGDEPLDHLVDGGSGRVVVEVDPGDGRAGAPAEQSQALLGRVEVVGRGEHLVARREAQAPVHQAEAHRGAVGQGVLPGHAAVVRRRGRPHRVLALDPGEQGRLGVEPELVAVAADGRLEDVGVRGQHERRELGQRGVEQELRLHGLPVLRVERRRGARAPVHGRGRGRGGLLLGSVAAAAGQGGRGTACQADPEQGASGRRHRLIMGRTEG